MLGSILSYCWSRRQNKNKRFPISPTFRKYFSQKKTSLIQIPVRSISRKLLPATHPCIDALSQPLGFAHLAHTQDQLSLGPQGCTHDLFGLVHDKRDATALRRISPWLPVS